MIMKVAFGSLHNHARYIYDVVMDARHGGGRQVKLQKSLRCRCSPQIGLNIVFIILNIRAHAYVTIYSINPARYFRGISGMIMTLC